MEDIFDSRGFFFLSYYMRNMDLRKASTNPQRSSSNHTPPGSSALSVLSGMASATVLFTGQTPQDGHYFLWGIVVLPAIPEREGR